MGSMCKTELGVVPRLFFCVLIRFKIERNIVNMNPLDFLKERTLDLGAGVSNQLPDRVNLFLRYMSGLGDRNLDLDEKTLTTAREYSVDYPDDAYVLHKGIDNTGNEIEYKVLNIDNYGPWALAPRTGSVSAYSGGGPFMERIEDKGHNLSNTLGTYYVDANPEKGVRIIDRYDMENRFEDPDLISGKFQPRKAWNEISSLWNPNAGFLNHPDPMVKLRGRDQTVPFDFEHLKNTIGGGGYDTTHSPLTRLARAGMYITPWKPTPFDIDVNVPYEGKIGNTEVYNR